MRARVYLRIKNEKKKNVSVTIRISFLSTTPLDESNVKNGARVVTMCNAMQRNENHFGRVTFWSVRALPPPPLPLPAALPALHLTDPSARFTPHRRHRAWLAQRYETRRTATSTADHHHRHHHRNHQERWPRGRDGYTGRSAS